MGRNLEKKKTKQKTLDFMQSFPLEKRGSAIRSDPVWPLQSSSYKFFSLV